MSEDVDWRFINVRRLFIMLRRAILAGTQWVPFEPNSKSTWSIVQQELSLFLRTLWMKGYFAGTTPEEAFIVKCDEELNSSEVVDSGRMMIDIRVAPALPAEFIFFTLEQNMNEQAEATKPA